MSDQRLHIAIDVDVADDQIRGHVCEGAREPRQFIGWLGLIGELDGMLGSRRQDIADPALAPHIPVASEDGDGGCEKGGGGSR